MHDYLPKVHTTVADDGALQGFICMHGTAVAGLFVHPRVQNTGVGSALLNSQDAQSLEVLEANLPARAFYAKHGFAQTGQRVHDRIGLMLCCLTRAPISS